MKLAKEKILSQLLELEEMISIEKNKKQLRILKSKYTKLNNMLKEE